MPSDLPFKFTDHLDLIDWTGRISPPILERLGINPKNWIQSTRNFESSFKCFAGSIDKVKQTCENLGYKRLPNVGALLT